MNIIREINMNPIKKNAHSLLKLMIETGEEFFSNQWFNDRSQLNPTDINDAIYFLEKINAMKVLRADETPFNFAQVKLTSEGRIYYHDLVDKDQPHNTGGAKDTMLNNKNIFVVHGRNNIARDSLFSFLRALKLNPIEWDEAIKMTGKASPFIGEILNKAFSEAQAVVVLLSGDDEARLKKEFQSSDDPPYEKTLTAQARPNVLFEAGMAFGRHEDRTVLIQIGSELRPFSDIAGRHIIKLNNLPEQRNTLAQRLQTAGCPVDTSGRDWYSAGNFELSIMSSQNDDLAIANQNNEIDQLEIKDNAYWKKSDGDGPFCMLCKDENKGLIHMINNNDLSYTCPKCKNSVRGPDADKLADKVTKSSMRRAISYASGSHLNKRR
jgi:predicted nucleotide-binding protein